VFAREACTDESNWRVHATEYIGGCDIRDQRRWLRLGLQDSNKATEPGQVLGELRHDDQEEVMNVIVRARAMATLGGATELVAFVDHEDLASAVAHLMKCHLHHFAVLQDGRHELVVSPMAVGCLRDINFQMMPIVEE
jgi:hypothetical protein